MRLMNLHSYFSLKFLDKAYCKKLNKADAQASFEVKQLLNVCLKQGIEQNEILHK